MAATKNPTKNLIPISERSSAEVRAMASKGGKKSGEVRRQNKTFKEAINWLMALPVDATDDRNKALLEQYPNLTNREAVTLAMLDASKNDKDVRAAVYLRDTSGELPTQNINIEQTKPFEISIKTIE